MAPLEPGVPGVAAESSIRAIVLVPVLDPFKYRKSGRVLAVVFVMAAKKSVAFALAALLVKSYLMLELLAARIRMAWLKITGLITVALIVIFPPLENPAVFGLLRSV